LRRSTSLRLLAFVRRALSARAAGTRACSRPGCLLRQERVQLRLQEGDGSVDRFIAQRRTQLLLRRYRSSQLLDLIGHERHGVLPLRAILAR
jgi:hypothetical protein